MSLREILSIPRLSLGNEAGVGELQNVTDKDRPFQNVMMIYDTTLLNLLPVYSLKWHFFVMPLMAAMSGYILALSDEL